jgi:hypothetical protein
LTVKRKNNNREARSVKLLLENFEKFFQEKNIFFLRGLFICFSVLLFLNTMSFLYFIVLIGFFVEGDFFLLGALEHFFVFVVLGSLLWATYKSIVKRA